MNKNITIGHARVGKDAPAFIVAEMSGNHLQDYDRAIRIIHAAKEAGADAAELQALVDALPAEVPEYNCIIGLWGQPEARVAHILLNTFCRDNNLCAPKRRAVRYTYKRRMYDALCVRQRGKDYPVYVGPKYYENAGPWGVDMATEMLNELVEEGALIRREEDGLYALANWSDFRFDFSI